MDNSDRLNAMAQWMWDARTRRLPYRNLPDDLRPASIAEAYAAQEAYYRLAEPLYGAVAGAKIAHHHQGNAAIDGHHPSLRRRDLRADHPRTRRRGLRPPIS